MPPRRRLAVRDLHQEQLDAAALHGPAEFRPVERQPRALLELETTVVLYESPHRIAAMLEALREVFGEVAVVVARELTKQFEEIVRGTAAALHAHFVAGQVRGEFTFVIPHTKAPPSDE